MEECYVKSSLAPEGKSIAFRLDKDNAFEWIGEYDISADEFLLEILADEAVEQNVIIKESESRGIKGKRFGMRRRLLAFSQKRWVTIGRGYCRNNK